MQELKNIHKGETFYIVGKGPSIKDLKKESLYNGVIIALYEATEKIESFGLSPLYSMQKDKILYIPHYATLLVHKWESAKQNIDYQPMHEFDNDLLGIHRGCFSEGFSLQSALKMAEWMGGKKANLFCFDAHTKGDFTQWDGNKHDQYKKQVQGMKSFKSRIHYEFHC